MSVRVIGEVFERSESQHAARLVLIAIADNASQVDAVAWPSQREIQRKTRLSESALRDALRELEQLGELETRSAQDGRSRRNVYRVTVGKYAAVPVDESQIPYRLLDSFSRPPESGGGHGGPAGDGMNAGLAGQKNGRPPESGGGQKATTAGICADGPQDSAAASFGPEPSIEPSATAELAALLDGDAAAAERLHLELQALGAGPKLRMAALTHPALALAWIDVAKTDADRNPAGFVMAGIDSGELPSTRGESLRTTSKREQWATDTSWRLDAEDAHLIVDEWDDLDHGELAMWHQRVDEIREQHEPVASTAEAAA